MASGAGSLRIRREFGAELRRLRGKRRAVDVGAAINVHQSHVTRIENGDRNCTPEVLDRFIAYYGLADEAASCLRGLAAQMWDAEEPWWKEFGDSITANYDLLLQYESYAVARRDYHTVLVPAHLQTKEYSRAVTGVEFGSLGPDQVDDLVAVRSRRQRSLYEEPKLEIHAIIGEAALRYQVGGPTTHRAQLQHLLDATEMANVRLCVIPFSAGERGTQHSAFNVLRFEEPEPDVGFINTLTGSEIKTGARDVRRLNRLFDNLAKGAHSREDSRALISTILRELD